MANTKKALESELEAARELVSSNPMPKKDDRRARAKWLRALALLHHYDVAVDITVDPSEEEEMKKESAGDAVSEQMPAPRMSMRHLGKGVTQYGY